MITDFCLFASGYELSQAHPAFEIRGPGSLENTQPNLYTVMGILLHIDSGCEFEIDQTTCVNIFTNLMNACPVNDGYTVGGIMSDNCANYITYGFYDGPTPCYQSTIAEYCVVYGTG